MAKLKHKEGLGFYVDRAGLFLSLTEPTNFRTFGLTSRYKSILQESSQSACSSSDPIELVRESIVYTRVYDS